MLRPSPARVLHTVCKAPVAQPAQAIESERRAGPVSTQAFATKIVVRLDMHTRVEIEPVPIDGERGASMGALL